jgi:hypothetical protein
VNIVLDTNVLADYLLTFRPRHEDARHLFERLEGAEYVLHIPAHSYFELFSTVISEWRTDSDKVVLEKLFRPGSGRRIEVITIDLNFVRNHLVRPMPGVTAGDLPYALLSIRDNMLLITEDIKLRDETNRCGGRAMNIFDATAFLASGSQRVIR